MRIWSVRLFALYRSDEDSDYEITDQDVNKILIVTQTPPAFKKHPQGDRTGDHISRAKMTANMTKVINDGLFYYEQDLHESLDVSVNISQCTKSGIMLSCEGWVSQKSMYQVSGIMLSYEGFLKLSE